MKKQQTQDKSVPDKKSPEQTLSNSPIVKDSTATNAILKKAFLFSLLGMLLFIWVAGFNCGYHCDEMDMSIYGKANVAYYTSGGKDTSFKGFKNDEEDLLPLLKYYGSNFEYFAYALCKVTGTLDGPHEYDVRHILNEFIAVLAIMFGGLIARKIAGWRAALYTIWLLYLTPFFFGHSMINTKDMPFCAGYVASLYFMICFLEDLPTPKWKNSIFLMLSFAFATGTRIAGVLLMVYLGIFLVVYLLTNRELLKASLKNARSIILQLFTIGAGGMAIVVLTWPFLLQSPVKNFIETMGVVKKFPMKIKLHFEGVVMDSLHVPSYYVPKFMFITIPLFIIGATLVGFTCYILLRKMYNLRIGTLLFFAIFFPLFYLQYTNAAVYCGWRHFLFVYPEICVFAAIGIHSIIIRIRKPAIQIGVLTLFALTFIKPVAWSIKNHYYEYTYFNALGGGFDKAFYNYENEYWQITTKKAVDWMMHNNPIQQSKDSITIATNARAFLHHYIRVNYPGSKVKVIGCGYTERNSVVWQYAVFHSIFLEPNYLENCWPPPYTVHSENIDDIPITVVIKDTVRYDFRGITSLMYGNYNQADSFLNIYFKGTGGVNSFSNVDLYPYLSIIRGYQFRNEEAISFANKCTDFYMPPNLMYFAYCGLAIGYANEGKFAQGINACNSAIKLLPDQILAKSVLNDINRFIATKQVPGGPASTPPPQGK